MLLLLLLALDWMETVALRFGIPSVPMTLRKGLSLVKAARLRADKMECVLCYFSIVLFESTSMSSLKRW